MHEGEGHVGDVVSYGTRLTEIAATRPDDADLTIVAANGELLAGEAALADAMRQLKAAGATLVVITHRLPLLSVVDKVMVLLHGAVEKFGTLADVLPRSGQAAVADAAQVVAGKFAPRG